MFTLWVGVEIIVNKGLSFYSAQMSFVYPDARPIFLGGVLIPAMPDQIESYMTAEERRAPSLQMMYDDSQQEGDEMPSAVMRAGRQGARPVGMARPYTLDPSVADDSLGSAPAFCPQLSAPPATAPARYTPNWAYATGL